MDEFEDGKRSLMRKRSGGRRNKTRKKTNWKTEKIKEKIIGNGKMKKLQRF